METESIWSLPIGGLGIQVRRIRELEPHLERDAFSGGVNIDARERNLERLNQARVYRASLPRVQLSFRPAPPQYDEYVLAPEHMIAKLAIECDSPYTMKRRHPALMQWVRQEAQMRESDRLFTQRKAKAEDLLRRVDAALKGEPV